MDKPLQIETAKASMDKPTAMISKDNSFIDNWFRDFQITKVPIS